MPRAQAGVTFRQSRRGGTRSTMGESAVRLALGYVEGLWQHSANVLALPLLQQQVVCDVGTRSCRSCSAWRILRRRSCSCKPLITHASCRWDASAFLHHINKPLLSRASHPFRRPLMTSAYATRITTVTCVINFQLHEPQQSDVVTSVTAGGHEAAAGPQRAGQAIRRGAVVHQDAPAQAGPGCGLCTALRHPTCRRRHKHHQCTRCPRRPCSAGAWHAPSLSFYQRIGDLQCSEAAIGLHGHFPSCWARMAMHGVLFVPHCRL